MSSKAKSFFRSIWNGLGSIGKGFGTITLFPKPMTDWQIQEEIHRHLAELDEVTSSFSSQVGVYKVPDQDCNQIHEKPKEK